LHPDRRAIAIGPSEFPTDRYVVAGIAAARGLEVLNHFDRLDDVAVMVRSVVDYRTAEVADIVGETARAAAAGSIALWDLSHAAGVLTVDLGAAGVQLAVGCYKYQRRPGTGVRSARAAPMLPQPIWGWFARPTKSNGFAVRATERHPPIAAGTPSIRPAAADGRHRPASRQHRGDRGQGARSPVSA
jgi:kynureninase